MQISAQFDFPTKQMINYIKPSPILSHFKVVFSSKYTNQTTEHHQHPNIWVISVFVNLFQSWNLCLVYFTEILDFRPFRDVPEICLRGLNAVKINPHLLSTFVQNVNVPDSFVILSGL